jgi:hypothetical protein
MPVTVQAAGVWCPPRIQCKPMTPRIVRLLTLAVGSVFITPSEVRVAHRPPLETSTRERQAPGSTVPTTSQKPELPGIPGYPSLPAYPDDAIVATTAPIQLPGSGGVSDGGQATYTLPLTLPDGPGGLKPNLSIEYDGGSANGRLGVGMTLSGLSTIAPCRQTLASEGSTDGVDFDRTDSYCLDGQKLVPEKFGVLDAAVMKELTARIQDPQDARRLKLCVMDEAWRFIQHPTLRAYLQEGLKTWRKRNAAMLLATQTVEDFASADLLQTVIESCPTKLLLANPALERRRYADLFQLNEMELDLLTGLIPRQQLLLKRPNLTKVLTLTVDPKSYWIYTNTPIDADRAAVAVN